ncbi:MAG: alginate export family protein [Acidobacteria bacterium]|nr:alginate export family protein [Acidobacteriota bacterium]
MALFFFTASGSPAVAGEKEEKKDGKAQEAPVAEKSKRVEFGVELRWRAEFRDNADFLRSDDFDHFWGQRVRPWLRFQLHPQLSVYVQGQDVWLFGAESDKVPHSLGVNLHQAYLDWKPGGSEQWELRAGRQELIYGEERLVGAFGWDNVGRSFDAARLRYQRGEWTGDFFWGRLVEVRRGGAPHRAGNQDLYGVYVTRAPKEAAHRTEVYSFFLRDGLRTVGEQPLGPAQAVRIFTVGFRHFLQPKTGWRYSVEHAWQFGERGPDSHRAAMLVASSGYAWGGRWQPRLGFEYDFATGDNDPSDGRSREFNNLFPTNHIYYGYADLAGLRNLHDFRLTAAARLHPKVTFEADYHRFLLAARRGPWKNAGGRVLGFDPTGAAGRDLGQEVDLTVRVPVERHVSLLAGYSVFLPGRFAARTRGPETHHFGYIQTTVKF